MRTSRRLYAETWKVSHQTFDTNGEPNGEIPITLTVASDPLSDNPNQTQEVVFTDAGKTGTGITLLLNDIGIWVSRLIQGRHPETGEELLNEQARNDKKMAMREVRAHLDKKDCAETKRTKGDGV